MNTKIVKRVEIIEIDNRKSKAGNDFRVCQCIVHMPQDDGTTKKRVGELMVFKKEMELAEGAFIAEFDVTVNFDKQVVAELVRLVPFLGDAPGASRGAGANGSVGAGAGVSSVQSAGAK